MQRVRDDTERGDEAGAWSGRIGTAGARRRVVEEKDDGDQATGGGPEGRSEEDGMTACCRE